MLRSQNENPLQMQGVFSPNGVKLLAVSGPSRIYYEVSSLKVFSIERVKRCLDIFLAHHRYKCKPARPSGLSISDHLYGSVAVKSYSCAAEKFFQFFLCYLERKISYEKFIAVIHFRSTSEIDLFLEDSK